MKDGQRHRPKVNVSFYNHFDRGCEVAKIRTHNTNILMRVVDLDTPYVCRAPMLRGGLIHFVVLDEWKHRSVVQVVMHDFIVIGNKGEIWRKDLPLIAFEAFQVFVFPILEEANFGLSICLSLSSFQLSIDIKSSCSIPGAIAEEERQVAVIDAIVDEVDDRRDFVNHD